MTILRRKLNVRPGAPAPAPQSATGRSVATQAALLAGDLLQLVLTAVALAGAGGVLALPTPQMPGPLRILSRWGASSSGLMTDWLVDMVFVATADRFQTGPGVAGALLGTAGFGGTLVKPVDLAQGEQLTVTITNNNAGPQTISVVLNCVWLNG